MSGFPRILPRTHPLRFLSNKLHKSATILTGDGNSPPVVNQVVEFLKSINLPINFDVFEGTPNKARFDEILNSVRKNKVALKGAWHTSLEDNSESLNHALRRDLDLWANVVHVKSIPFIGKRSDVDFIIIRQNTEGEYSQIEHESVPGYIEMFKVITAERSSQIAEFAFEYAIRNNRKKVTCIHKANIMKMGDGLFLSKCREVASRFPQIKFNDLIVDNAAMQLVMHPHLFDVLLLPNLYGNIMVAIGAGLIGSTGLLSGANLNGHNDLAVFEPAARGVEEHQTSPDKINPCNIIFAACAMLRRLDHRDVATKIEKSVYSIIRSGPHTTTDVGGKATTIEFLEELKKVYKMT